MKILYLTLESYKSQPILKSQVITLLSHLSNKYSVKDQKIKFFLTTRDQDIIPEINNDKLVHIPLKNDSYFINQFELLKKVSKIAAQVDVIHVRSYLPMLVALLLKLIYKKKVIFDMRGVFPEEMALRKKSRYIFFLFKKLESLYCRYADKLVVVSQNFRKHIEISYSKQSDKVIVIPTFAIGALNSQCSNSAKVMNIKEEVFNEINGKIFVYSGAFEKWQCVEETFDLFEKLERNIEEARFVVFSQHWEQFEDYAKGRNIDISKYYFTYVENKYLNAYIKQCDVGILLRKDNIINQVAAPIKFTDYLSGGLLVMVSDNIGDTSVAVKKYDLGYVLEKLDNVYFDTIVAEVSLTLQQKLINREQKANMALDELSLKNAADRYYSLYLQLA